MNESRLDEVADLAHRLEDLQFEIHALLDAEQTDAEGGGTAAAERGSADAEGGGTAAAIQVLTSALSHVGTAVAELDSLMPASDEDGGKPDDDTLTDELIDSPGG